MQQKAKTPINIPLKSKVLFLPYFFISFALNWAGDLNVIFGSTHVGRKVFQAGFNLFGTRGSGRGLRRFDIWVRVNSLITGWTFAQVLIG